MISGDGDLLICDSFLVTGDLNNYDLVIVISDSVTDDTDVHGDYYGSVIAIIQWFGVVDSSDHDFSWSLVCM